MKPATWNEIIAALDSRDVDTSVAAAARLQAEASIEDVPALLRLLREGSDFFVREAAAWPLAELVGPKVLPELLAAYQLGLDEGHDNDGFTAALLEIPALYPAETKTALEQLEKSATGHVREHALWLLEFCE